MESATLHKCGVDGYLIRNMSSLYNEIRSCVRLSSIVGKHFEVKRGLRQGCVMSPWVFNIFFDKVVRQMNEKAMGKGVKLREENGEGWEISTYYMQMIQL